MNDQLTVGSLFDGVGLLAYGLHLAGLQHRWLCEVDPFRQAVLNRRFPGVPVHRDVRAVGARNAERVDVIAGGVPCKGASSAGKQGGFDHPETRLWREMRRIVDELQPRFVLIENVASLLTVKRGAVWGEILDDLASLGFYVQWDCFPAGAFGAPHLRDRLIAVAAHPDRAPADTFPAAGRSWPPVRERDRAATADADGTGEQWLASLGGQPDGRPDARGSAPATADADRGARELRRGPGNVGDPPEASRNPASEGRPGEYAPTDRPEAAPDPRRAGREELDRTTEPIRPEHARAAIGRGVAVQWGEYEPAIRRWERIVGPAPEPLVRRVDDGRTGWVERSRLSALGDGVLVQLGWMVGSWLTEQATRAAA